MILTLLVFSSWIAQASPWDTLLDSGQGKQVQWGTDLSEPVNYQRNAHTEFKPASTAKVATAALALAHLGPNYRYLTRVVWRSAGGTDVSDLRLLGSGDPSWGLGELGESLRGRADWIAKGLAAQGVRRVYGPITAGAVDSRWENLEYPEGWLNRDKLTCYGTLPQAFNININCAQLRVSGPSTARWVEEGVPVPVELDITKGSRNSLYVCSPLTAPIRAYRICGTWKSGTHGFTLPVHDTTGWARNLFANALKRQGVELVDGPPPVPHSQEQLREFFSPELRQIIRPFLKNSIGVLGEAIHNHLGILFTNNPSPYEGGRELMRNFLAGYGSLSFQDGSGLSRESRATPAALLRFLADQSRQEYFPALHAALAVAGVDGTLRNRMKGTAAQGKLRGKTGTLNGVYNLAGYVKNSGGYVPFVLLTSTNTGLASTARGNQNKVGVRLATELRGIEERDGSAVPYIGEHAGPDDQ